MKKVLSLLLSLAMIVALGTVGLAADYDKLADDLAAIGMFKGTGEGYELDREPTRAEVAVMLVRMLGAEEAAAEGYADETFAHPFEDVAEWAAPYVAYLYTNKLANGISETEFGSADLCSCQMYCTFMLRALGYSDAEDGDFLYTDAVAFAVEKGIANAAFTAKFTRDSLVAVSYQTLLATVKDGEDTLLSKLVADGAIDAEAAAVITSKVDLLKEFLAINAAYENAKAMDCSIVMDVTMVADGIEITMSGVKMDMKMNMTDTTIEAAITTSMKDPLTGEDMVVEQWMKDGFMYTKSGDEAYKVPMDYAEMLESLEQSLSVTGDIPVNNSAIYLYNDITKTETDEGTLYTLSFAPKFFESLLDTVLGSEALPVTAEVNVAKIEYATLVKDGVVKSITFDIDMSVDMGELGAMGMQMVAVMDINAMGETVEIVFPDFTDFEELPAVVEEDAAEATDETEADEAADETETA